MGLFGRRSVLIPDLRLACQPHQGSTFTLSSLSEKSGIDHGFGRFVGHGKSVLCSYPDPHGVTTLVSLQEVRQLEVLCKQLYESQDANRRSEAEKALVTFQNATDSLNKCQLLLERGDSPYSQLLATTTLTKLISRTAQVLSLQQRIDIRKFSWTKTKYFLFFFS